MCELGLSIHIYIAVPDDAFVHIIHKHHLERHS